MRLSNVLAKKLQGFRPGASGWASALCPFHKDSTPSFFVNLSTGRSHCFGCSWKGSLQELLHRLHIRSITAQELLPKGHKHIVRRDPDEVNVLPNYILGAYRKCPSSLVRAGFDKRLLASYDIGFDQENYRITFPIRAIGGQLAAVSGRNLQGKPKYQVYEEEYEEIVPNYKPRPKDHLWNLHNLDDKIRQDGVDVLYLVEGYKACLWMIQHGYDAVASMGAGMTRRQVSLLSKYDVPLVLFLDDDEAGRMATLFNYLELSRTQIARVVAYPEGAKQPDDLDAETLKQTLENPQEFRRWFRERIQIEDVPRWRLFHKRSQPF